MKIYVQKVKSEKSGKEYPVVKVDFGYRIADLFIDISVMAELAQVSIKDIYSLKLGDTLPISVGN